MGHLHPGCSKDIVVTMKSDVPINLKKMGVKCKLSKIIFQLPADQVPDWDDRMRTVKWVGCTRNTSGALTTKRKVNMKRKPDLAHHCPPSHCLIISFCHGKYERFTFCLTVISKKTNCTSIPAILTNNMQHVPHTRSMYHTP